MEGKKSHTYREYTTQSDLRGISVTWIQANLQVHLFRELVKSLPVKPEIE